MLLTNKFIISAERTNSVVNYHYGFMYYLFGLYTIVLGYGGIILLIITSIKSNDIVRKQTQYILLEIFITVLFTVFFNVILPISGNNKYIDKTDALNITLLRNKIDTTRSEVTINNIIKNKMLK